MAKVKKRKAPQRRKSKPQKEKRPSIPRSVQLKLWVLSGGRCEFRGCNKPLWRDGLTLKEANYSNIAHIISWTPSGPRGDRSKSRRLATNFKNLMLVCSAHNKTIDDPKLVDQYPVSLLTAYKREHEERIKTLCEIQESNQSHILILKGKIGEHTVEIDESEAYQAILPRYPADESGIHIDLTSFSSDSADFWRECVFEIRRILESKLNGRNDNKRIKHLSIFAFAPIPLLIKLGHLLGDKIATDLFQYHRTTQSWGWPESGGTDPAFSFQCLKESESTKEVGLLLSLSGKIHENEVTSFVGENAAIYEISIPNPDPLFIKTADQIFSFRALYWHVLSDIRKKHGPDCSIHLFPATPLAISVECGRSILPKVHPKILIYDNDKKHGGFRYIFDLQEASSR